MNIYNKTNRICWIDNLKGLILLLVCLAHLDLDVYYLAPARMTTFFFLSGFLFNNKYSPKSYLKNKLNSLLIPYLNLSILFALIPPQLFYFNYNQEGIIRSIFIYLSTHDVPYQLAHYITNIYTNIIDIFQGYSYAYGTAPLWFVYTLFQVSCIYYFFDYIIKSRTNKLLYKSILCISSLLIGWFLNLHSINLPFHIHTMVTALFFFILGDLLKKPLMQFLNQTSNIKLLFYTLFLIITYGIFVSIMLKNKEFIIINTNDLGKKSIFLFLLETTCGIFMLISIFKLISNHSNIIFGIFRNIAKNALIVLCMHYYIMVLCDVFLSSYISQKSYIFVRLIIVAIGTIIAIPIFRNKLYWLIGKNKITIKESLSIK